MADVKWIKLKVGMFDGMSFKKIKRAKIGGESFRDKLTAVWFELMDFAGKCNHSGAFIDSREIPFTSIEDIATMIDRDPEELQLCMAFYINEGMVSIIDDVYMLSNWMAYQNGEGLEKIREQKRIAQAKWREKKRLEASNVDGDVDSTATSTDNLPSYSYSLSSSTSQSSGESTGECEGGEKPKPPTKKEIEAFFESVWKKYPNKKGKGQISDAKKKALYAIGAEEIERAIERYCKELEKDKWRQPQYGSTFFNSGYVDYLDANYSPTEGGVKNGGFGTDHGKAQFHGNVI